MTHKIEILDPKAELSTGPFQLGQLQEIQAFEIQSQPDLDFANQLLRAVVAEKDRLTAQLKRYTQPLQDLLTVLRDDFRPFIAFPTDAESSLKKKIAGFVTAERDRAAAAHAMALEAAQARDHQTAALAMNVAQAATVQAPQGTNVRYVWKARIVNPYLLPQEYLKAPKVLEALLTEANRYARSFSHPQLPTPLPGVLFDAEEIVCVRRG